MGEPEVPLFERIWARPTLEVHGIRGGFTGEGAKTVIPARATAKISMRLVADQKPEEALEQFKARGREGVPQGRHGRGRSRSTARRRRWSIPPTRSSRPRPRP